MATVRIEASSGEGFVGLNAAARQVALLRLLLVAIAAGVLILSANGHGARWALPALQAMGVVLGAVAVASVALAVLVGWVRQPWQLALQLVFDVLWTGMTVFATGGVSSPGVVLLFAVVLIGNLVLPGVAPFVLPAIASLALATDAALYLANWTPFPPEFFQANPGLSDANRILGVLATQVAALFTVDVLGQLLARRLREQAIFTGELLDQLGEGVLAVDRTGAVAYANEEAIRLLRLPLGSEGRPVQAVLGPELRAVRELLARDDLPVLERLDGPQQHQLVVRLTRLVDRRGRDIGRTLLIADETRLRTLEDSARRAEHLAALGEMAAGIAHEVRNPLTSLRGCAQEIADIMRGDGRTDAADLATILVGEADRLGRIVDDFLVLSRMREPDRRPLELQDLLPEIERLVRQRVDLPPGLALSFAVDDECPAVSADPDQLRQVLDNLIGNALDALRQVPTPRLVVTAQRSAAGSPTGPDSVELVVADNGHGIPAELQERVFTPFFSTKSRGTGLGLSLVQRIVREHEGTLRLESTPGQGTTVRIHLPSHSQTRIFVRALGGR